MIDNLQNVRIEKLVPGGQGMGRLANGKTVFVWNALPGEMVRARVVRQKRNFAEGIAEEIMEPSPERITPREANYLATSPWQMMTFEAENRYKKDIVAEMLVQHKVGFSGPFELTHDMRTWHYRNKMEYSFWGDETGLHLALHKRSSHGKQVVAGSELAMPAIDAAASSICDLLGSLNVRAGDLKTIVVRSDQNGRATASLFVKPTDFPKLDLPAGVAGLRVYHSNPKSPASVPTRLLYEAGDCKLTDELLGRTFTYDVDSFFQVNVPMFERALERIKQHCQADEVVDMYAGVGSIGLSVAKQKVELVELDAATAKMARNNAQQSGLQTRVIETSTEKALEYVVRDRPAIFDPPRAGLHDKVTARVLEVCPPQILYLSCNPATQARDLAKLQEKYSITHFEAFNFFPRTPHIETLAILQAKVE